MTEFFTVLGWATVIAMPAWYVDMWLSRPVVMRCCDGHWHAARSVHEHRS